jgi:cell division protein FtsN
MPNDMKPKAPPRVGGGGGGKPGMNPLFAGIIIGLLMGIFLALGVAIWLNRTSNPFVEKTRQVEPPPGSRPLSAAPSTSSAVPATNKATNPVNPDKPRFEFYQILPGEKDSTGKKAPEPAAKEALKTPPPAAPKDTPKEAPKESVPLKSLNETLYLQAGAFQNEAEAENLKAKIAFSGFEATVKPVNVAGKGTLYRVRLGPYKSQEEVNRIKGVLSQAGIGAAVVKPE